MVKATLPEPQTWVLEWEAAHVMVDVPFGVGGRSDFPVNLEGSATMEWPRFHPNRATRLPSGGYGRTGHLTAPHLLHRVNTGSPERAALHSPAWRRSRHSSRRPGVTPGTAAGSRTDVAETDRATGRGTPAIRVKGGASVETAIVMTAAGIADAYRCRGDGAASPSRGGGCRSRMMRKYQVRFRGRGRGDVE